MAGAAGVGDRVLALRAEADALPFAVGSFDAIVCIDAFENFGTSEHHLAHLTRSLVPGGQLGVATPALRNQAERLSDLPAHVRACVGGEALAWHTADWWRSLCEATGLVEAVTGRLQENGWDDWLLWQRVVVARSSAATVGGNLAALDMLEGDQGQSITFALLTARTPA